MKLACSVEKLKNAITYAERVTGKNLSLPVLGSILLIASEKRLKLRATNLSIGIELEVPAKIEEEGVAAISGSVLSAVFTNIPQTETVHLEEKAGNVVIKTKRSEVLLKGQPHEDFPTIPAVTGTEFDIDAKKLVDGIKNVYYSSSASDIKPEISSVYLYTQEDNLVFVSTDSFRLAEKKIKAKGVSDVPGIILPLKNVIEILRVLGELSGEVKVHFNKNQISFAADTLYLTSRVIDGAFPDYRQIIPPGADTEIVVLKQDLLGALKLANVFSDKFNQINLVADPARKLFELSSKSNDVGENTTALDAVVKGDPIELSFNYRYFLDCFQSLSTDSVAIKLSGPGKPMIVSPVSDTSFTYLIMPMNK